jgi:O-antigen/teichoic acid export membrane protein
MILVAAFLATASMNYGLGLLLAWLLVPEEFGYVAIAQAVLYVTAVTLDAGFPWTLTRTLSRAHGDWTEVSDVLRSTLIGNLVFAAFLAAGILLLDAAGTFGLPRREPPVMLLVALTLPFFAVNSIARAALHGMTRFGALGVVKSVEVLSKVLFITGLVLLLGRGTLLLVVLGTFAGAVATAILAAWFTRDLRPDRGAGAWGPTYLRTIPMFVGTVSMALLLHDWAGTARNFHNRRHLPGRIHVGSASVLSWRRVGELGLPVHRAPPRFNYRLARILQRRGASGGDCRSAH